MPAQKSAKPAPIATKAASKASAKSEKTVTKAKPVPVSKAAAKPAAPSAKEAKASKAVAAVAEEVIVVKKKPGRPPKVASADGSAPATGAKRGRKPKAAAAAGGGEADDVDMSDIEGDLVGEPEGTATTGEKVKPLRMKISKAKERALMKEFGLDETVLSEEDMAKRRARLKALITLGKTRG